VCSTNPRTWEKILCLGCSPIALRIIFQYKLWLNGVVWGRLRPAPLGSRFGYDFRLWNFAVRAPHDTSEEERDLKGQSLSFGDIIEGKK
jgi:hypothetical protein